MSPSTYNAITILLLGWALLALVFAAVYLIAALVGWQTPNRKPRLLRFLICLVALPALLGAQQAVLWKVFLPSYHVEVKRQRQARIDEISIVRVGDVAPSFSVTDTEGKEFDLSQHKGKVVLVNFFATWCGPCLKELPHVERLWCENHANEDFALIVLGREETTEKVAAYKAKHQFSFPMAADPDRGAFKQYAKDAIPRTYLIAPDGNVCFEITGFDQEDFAKLELELARQLAALK